MDMGASTKVDCREQLQNGGRIGLDEESARKYER